MIRQTYTLEIITPCFCAGANPAEAEIRASSIRGQLRWWFRVLGGFKSLAPISVREQEAMIFGSAAGDVEIAGKLQVRVKTHPMKQSVKDGQQLGHPNFSDSAFLTFPIQSREKGSQKTQYNGRGVIADGRFDLIILWKGGPQLQSDICALVAVFGLLGSLGFRGRRAMGALAFVGSLPISLPTALSCFVSPEAIAIKSLVANSAENAISILGGWLRSCRSHGRSGQNEKETKSAYFKYAKNDHDIGYSLPETQGKDAFRPALGLPIIQRIRNGTNNWEWDWNAIKGKAEGRFASPVILRPHRDAERNWHALVIFVEALKWPEGKQVFLNGKARSVSLDLYEAMKRDSKLAPFP